MAKTIQEAYKYEVVMFKRLGMKHRKVKDYQQKDIYIRIGEITNIMKLCER